MIRAVIFDIDNTFYPYDPCDRAGIENMYLTFTKIADCTRDGFNALLSEAKRDIKSMTAGTAACHNRLLYVQRICELSGCYSSANVLDLYDSYWNAYLENIELYDNVCEVLESLRLSGIKIGFCTDLTANIQMRKIVRLGIDEYPDAVVTSEECGAEKPSEVPFRMILKKLGVCDPSEAVMVGDDPLKDYQGAINAGMKAILFGNGSDDSVRVSDFYELEKALKGMIG